MAWIYKRGAQWWIGTRSNGKKIQRALGTTQRTKAEEELGKVRLIEQAQARNAATTDLISAITGRAAVKPKTVSQYFTDWLAGARVHLTPGTVQKYEQLAREFSAHVKADIAPVLLESITVDDVRGFLLWKRERTTFETTKGFRRILASVFLQAVNEGVMSRNPVALAKLPKRAQATEANGKRAFTLAEVKSLFDTTESEFWKWMIQLSFCTGMALSDAVTLRRQSVDLSRKLITYNRRKTGKAVNVGIPPQLVEVLKSRWPKREEDFFWPDEADRYLNRGGASGFSQEFHALMAKCGLVQARDDRKKAQGEGRGSKREQAGLGFHCLRHTYVTMRKLEGTAESVAMEAVGHGSKAISRTYTHVPEGALIEAASRVPDFTKEAK